MRFCQAYILCFKALATKIKSATLINQTYSQKYPHFLHESTLKMRLAHHFCDRFSQIDFLVLAPIYTHFAR